jgi:hypothetical protein
MPGREREREFICKHYTLEHKRKNSRTKQEYKKNTLFKKGPVQTAIYLLIE